MICFIALTGCEFTAVFLGTCETTDERGVPNNTTKTIINHYVFNTALTRAKYLVVAVGNPLQLLEKEKEMYKHDPSNHCFWCWREYIKRCVECKSFLLPADVAADKRKQFAENLYQYIYTETQNDSNLHADNTQPNDSILSAYKEKLKQINECKGSKLKLSRVHGRLTWQIDESNAPQNSSEENADKQNDKADTYECRLNMISYSKAEAIPLDSSKGMVHIRGMGNVRGAFHEDIVQVSVFSESLHSEESRGKVVSVVRKCHKETLLCRASQYSPTLFYPIDKRYPIVSNLPKLSKDMLEKKDKSKIDVELQSKDVVIFESSSLKEGNIPEIKNVLPFSLAQDMVFVLKILRWNPKYRFPLGVAIQAVPKGCSPFQAERLLRIEHNVHYEDETDCFQAESGESESDATTSANVDTRAFTIDPDDALNLDDAISLWKQQDYHCLSVHIVNTTKEIEPDNEIDKKAGVRGQSVYGGDKVMNILPSKTRAKLTLYPHKTCDVITIHAKVIVSKCAIEMKDVQLKESQIKSCLKLSYKSAQAIMEGKEYPHNLVQEIQKYNSIHGQPSLQAILALLLRISQKLRAERLGEVAAQCYEMDDPNEQECWQMHLMVEEMMIWANKTVAATLLSAFPECALLRRQGPPNHEELEAAKSSHCNVIQYSQSLSQYRQPAPGQPDIVIPLSTLRTLLQAIKEQNVAVLLNLLTDDTNYPQLNAAFAYFRRIQQKAEYVSASEGEEKNSYEHYSLCLPAYTHFTSPLRRYADIVVQRMLKSFIAHKPCQYSHEEVESLCYNLNRAARNAKSFEKQMKALKLAVEYTESSQLQEAVITRNTRTEIEISFLKKELKVFPARNRKFKVQHLKCKKETLSRKTESDAPLYSWNVTLMSVDDTSSFPYDYEDISFPAGGAFGCATPDNALSMTMTLFQELSSHMLKSVTLNVKASPTTAIMTYSQLKYIKKLIKRPSKQNLDKIHGVLNSKLVDDFEKTPLQSQIKSAVVKCDIACRMDTYDLLKVWVSWATHEGILSPAMEMIEVAPFFRICLKHNTHPAQCFSDSHLVNASKDRYTNLDEYVSLWEKVLLAEAAEISVSDNKTGIIYGAKLDWGKLVIPEEVDATHYKPAEPLQLTLSSSLLSQAGPFFKITVGDMVCARYGTSKNSNIRAVFHFVVTNVKKGEEEEDMVNFTLNGFGRENNQISEKMKPCIEQEVCELQIIRASISYR